MTRNTLVYGIKLIVSVSILVALWITFDLASVWKRLEIHSPVHLVFALCLFLLLLVNNTFRWALVLRATDYPSPFSLLFRLQYIAAFFNQALPSVVGGDAMRIYLCHKSGTPLKTSVNSVLLERTATLAGLIFLVTGLQSFILPLAETGIVQFLFPALSIIALSGIGTIMLLDRLPARIRPWKIVGALAHTAKDARRVFLSARYCSAMLAFSFAGSVIMSLIALCGARALGIQIATLDAIVLIPPAILASALPISIAGWGVREGAMVVSLTYAGVSEADALVVSIMFGLTMAVASIPGGIFWIMNKSQKPNQG